MTPQLQAAIKQWSTLLNEALQRHAARKPERILNPGVVKATIVMRLKNTGVTDAVYDQWLAGTGYPSSRDQHEALLDILRESSTEAELNAMRSTREYILAAKHATKIPDRVHSTGSSSSIIPSRRDTGPLTWLRTVRSPRPYEELKPNELNDTLLNTPSAAEFLHCFRVKYFPGVPAFEAALRGGFLYGIINHWEIGKYLPDPASLAKLNANYFGKNVLTDGTLAYERFETLVTANRRLLMMQALRDGKQKKFGALLSYLSANATMQELRNFMQPPAIVQDELPSQAENASALSLIASKGTYLHFLRHALSLSQENTAREIRFSSNKIKGMEEDGQNGAQTVSISAYKTYQDYLEGKLAEQDERLTQQELADGRKPSVKLSDLLKNPEVRAHVDALKPVRPPKSYWAAIADMPAEGHGQGV